MLLLTHGAGLPSDSPWMKLLADKLGSFGIAVERFDFDYMTRSKAEGRRRPPPRAERLVEEFAGKAKRFQGQKIYLSGKSLGGRVAALLACEMKVAGVIAFGYPFHPPGKPENLRVRHFPQVQCPVLICQGTRDPFGTFPEVEALELPSHFKVQWLPDGNHDLRPPKRSTATFQGNLELAAQATAEFYFHS